MTEQIERGALHSNQSFIGCSGVARIFWKATKMGIGEDFAHPISELDTICARSIDDKNGKRGIVLGAKARQRFFKPSARVMGHHHRDDGGGRPFRFLCLEEGFETRRCRIGFGRSSGTLAQRSKKVVKDRLRISTRWRHRTASGKGVRVRNRPGGRRGGGFGNSHDGLRG